jgi:putative nucleotidyltransferase with HDIG domain
MFTRPHAGRGLELMDQSGLLGRILPEIEAMKGVGQPPEHHPEGDVFVHTKLLMDQLDDASPELAFGALLHDVGKPPTYSDEGGHVHFYNHAHIGAQMAESILRRLRFSNRQIEDIVSCVENHMKFADVKRMREGKLKQFTMRDNFKTELELHKIDCLASHGNLDLHEFLTEKLVIYEKEARKPKPLVNGHDLLELGHPPGPSFKEILQELYTFQLENKFRSKEEAMEWVRGRYPAEPQKGKG